MVVDRSILREPQAEMDTLNELVASPWIQELTPADLPQLPDIITLELAESDLRSSWESRTRIYDEKFHILQSPQLLWDDIRYFREACALRGVSAGVAFVDIDDFKAVNTALTEPVVDEVVLPRFMLTLERSVFGRGFAYRMGGDEYILLLPNLSCSELRSFLGDLRTRVAQQKYPGTEVQTTISVGYAMVTPRTPLTDREIVEAAASAKARAKDAGRNRVAGFADGYCEPPSL